MYKEDSEVDLQLVGFLEMWPWWAECNGRRGIRRNGGIFRNVVIVRYRCDFRDIAVPGDENVHDVILGMRS